MPTNTSDLVLEAVRARVERALPKDWATISHPDFRLVPSFQYPLAIANSMGETLLEEETDNRILVGYTVGVAMFLRLAGQMGTESVPGYLRRKVQQALHTTNYPDLESEGVPPEWVTINEDIGADLAQEDEGISSSGFRVTLGIIEARILDEEGTELP